MVLESNKITMLIHVNLYANNESHDLIIHASPIQYLSDIYNFFHPTSTLRRNLK